MGQTTKPFLGITMGDPAGIGPEIVCKMFAQSELYGICRPIVIGDVPCLREGLKAANSPLGLHTIANVSEGKFDQGIMDVIDLHNVSIRDLRMGEPQAMAGKASAEYVQRAVELAIKGELDAIVTAPINKLALNMAGWHYSGHTELLADLTQTKDFAMLLIAGPLRVIHVSTHVSLAEAIRRVKKQRVITVIDLANQAIKEMGISQPRIAVAGLNPHAGEGGLFGNEEIEFIKPAIEESLRKGLIVVGPIAPDTVFLRTKNGEFDVVVAMYHDQGHIAVKMQGLEVGVNVSVGLPIIRTSVDHGTAYDIASTRPGTANPTSLFEATKLAVQMAMIRAKREL